jgi:hypothetical protein
LIPRLPLLASHGRGPDEVVAAFPLGEAVDLEVREAGELLQHGHVERVVVEGEVVERGPNIAMEVEVAE